MHQLQFLADQVHLIIGDESVVFEALAALEPTKAPGVERNKAEMKELMQGDYPTSAVYFLHM